MTDLQARILLICVQQAKRHGGQVPKAKNLVHLLQSHNIVEKITERAVNDHLQRLNQGHVCFIRKGRSRYLHEDLCTERESARYLIALQEQSSKDPDGRVMKKDFHSFLQSKLKISAQVLEDTFLIAKRACYLTEITAASSGFIRPDYRTEEQTPYLRLLASEFPMEHMKQSA